MIFLVCVRTLELKEYLNKDDITVGEGAASDYSFKILIIGDAGVLSIIRLRCFHLYPCSSLSLDCSCGQVSVVDQVLRERFLGLIHQHHWHRLQLQNDPS